MPFRSGDRPASSSVQDVLPPLAALADFRPNADWLKSKQIVGFRGLNAMSRPFSLLRSQILETCEANGFSVLGVVSAAPHEGKSFICANLAAALSRLPQLEVYILDLDLRRPSQASLFGLEIEQGLESFLRSGTPGLSHIGRRIEGTNLAVFPTAHADIDTVDVLHGAAFEALMRDARSKGGPQRIVLCDLPPVFVCDDAMAIAKHLDAYIHVVGAGQSNTRQFEELGRLLGETPSLGAILNRYVGGPFDDYGYGRYGSKYDAYFSEPS
jgi:Mrp family chromosome partitioning ATPase